MTLQAKPSRGRRIHRRQPIARHRQALSRQLAALVKEQAVYAEASSGLDPAWEAVSLEVLRREKW